MVFQKCFLTHSSTWLALCHRSCYSLRSLTQEQRQSFAFGSGTCCAG